MVVVVNPAAGGEPERLAAETTAVARRHGVASQLIRTGHPGHAEELAASASAGAEPADVVVAVGGDGTVRDVAAGMWRAGSAATLLVAPGGTGNSSYLGLWQDRPWSAVLAELFGGRCRSRRMDLARVAETGRVVLLGAATGLIAEALRAAAELSATPGRGRYQQAIAATLARWHGYPGQVEVDGVELARGATLLVNVGGGRYRGGGFPLLPQSQLDDGLLDVCVCAAGTDPMELAALVATGSHLEHPAVRLGRGRSVRIRRTDGQPITFEHDGELVPVASEQFTVSVLPAALAVALPEPLPPGFTQQSDTVRCPSVHTV